MAGRTAGRGQHRRLDASFDLGIPALRAVLEPIAAKSLHTNMTAVLRGFSAPTSKSKEGERATGAR